MTPSRRARELVEAYGIARAVFQAFNTPEAEAELNSKYENLLSYIATLEASATAPKGEAVACPQCGAPEGAICKSPFCVRLPPPSPKAEPNPSAVEAAALVIEDEGYIPVDAEVIAKKVIAALEAHRQDTSPPAEAAELAKEDQLLVINRYLSSTADTTTLERLHDGGFEISRRSRAALSGATHDR